MFDGNVTPNKSELFTISSCFPQTTTFPFTLRHALPEPNLAKKEAFWLKKSSFISGFKAFSKLIIFIDKAAIPEAEEAMPELCGKVFSVSIIK